MGKGERQMSVIQKERTEEENASTIAKLARTTLTMKVTVSGLVEGNPAQLGFYKVLTLRNETKKPCSQVVQVQDEDLLQRLRSEVDPGDRIRVTIETDWAEKDMPTVLTDFCSVPCPDDTDNASAM